MDASPGSKLSEFEAPLVAGSEAAQEPGALADFLRASRTEIEGLMEKSREIQQESLRNVNASFEQLHSKLYQELEDAAATFGNETRKRAQYEISVALDLFDVEASARLSARLDEAVEKARAACGEMELGIKERVEQHSQDALAKLLTSAVKELQGKAEAILEGFRAEVQNSLAALKSEAGGEVSEQLRKTKGQLADDLQNRADKAFEALNAQLTTAGKAVIAESERQIAALSQAALASLGQQAETVQRRSSEFVARDLRKRLDQVANALQHLEGNASNTELTES
jgi:hypothetical protein